MLELLVFGVIAICAFATGCQTATSDLTRQSMPAPTHAAESLTTITVVAGGDVIFGRPHRNGVMRPIVRDGAPLVALREQLESADLTLVNLETPLCDQPTVAWDDDRVMLWADPSYADDLAAAGIDVVSVANNHALDCGLEGIAQTVASLRSRGVEVAGLADQFGLPRPLDFEVDGVEVVIIAVNLTRSLNIDSSPRAAQIATANLGWGQGTLDLVRLVGQNREEKPTALLILSLHWGREWTLLPRTRQRALAEALFEVGADVVVGHGPHIVQPVDVGPDDRIVAYSLGNLLFDNPTIESRRGALLEVSFGREGTQQRGSWRTVGARLFHVDAGEVGSAPVMSDEPPIDLLPIGMLPDQ